MRTKNSRDGGSSDLVGWRKEEAHRGAFTSYGVSAAGDDGLRWFINKKYRAIPKAARQWQKENGIFIDARVRPDSTIYVSYVNRKICGAAEQALVREVFERREKEDTARTPKHKALGPEEIL